MNNMRNGNQRSQRRVEPNRQNSATPHGQNGAGNGHRNYERYMALAREATLNGDIIEAENCYQHAEHYLGVTRERQAE